MITDVLGGEQVLEIGVADSSDGPKLMELVGVEDGGLFAAVYVIRSYRPDEDAVPTGDFRPYSAPEARLVPHIRRCVRVRWSEATGGGELPAGVFEGASA